MMSYRKKMLHYRSLYAKTGSNYHLDRYKHYAVLALEDLR